MKATFIVENTRTIAMKMERWAKQQKSRKLIELLNDASFIPNGVLAQLVRVSQNLRQLSDWPVSSVYAVLKEK